ncbi:DUF2089 domain-containing protein [Meiothermus hypogaeus]|uniref:DUF2089 domain-containing protein n=2 Tax=Meiothermus hypogaeus TaxID=884155 RepID=A0A511R048_9DEIN|nr:DUF2089 domain-containing protein [Meiothermus hypogaeus]RIH80909.1 hypothetical protein Mhypo_00201 [Meiothermus hypogaeus]GEM82984.1 hypothetical protein MHY01S_11500 [Meiothermus hypogaeus NBRC 106114]GIW37086.1 MAG: hypothetical protein KatS3mg073_1231 [Meiothermus sp.]
MRVFPMPTQCPVEGCNGRLHVTELVCPDCRTEIRGEFRPNEFALLPPEHLEFLRLYVKVRGNLKEVERILGLSYPTIRARFEALLRVLGYEYQEMPEGPNPEEKEAILAALEKGQISAAEAAERLRALKKP